MPKVMAKKKKKLRREEEEEEQEKEGTFGNKEEEEEEVVPKKKSNSPIHSSKQKRQLDAIIKVPKNPEEEEEYDDESSKEGRKNTKKNKANEDEITLVKDRREEEVDYLPGQKHDRPGERHPLRVFYETLYQKLPEDELAETWMLEWGLLPPDKAKKVYETKLGKNQQEQHDYRVEDASLEKSSKLLTKKAHKRSSNSMLKTRKRKVSENSSGDDLRLSKRKFKKQRSSS